MIRMKNCVNCKIHGDQIKTQKNTAEKYSIYYLTTPKNTAVMTSPPKNTDFPDSKPPKYTTDPCL